jgi:hypothetical protein
MSTKLTARQSARERLLAAASELFYEEYVWSRDFGLTRAPATNLVASRSPYRLWHGSDKHHSRPHPQLDGRSP